MNHIRVANPDGKGCYRHMYVLCFGAYGDHYLLAYADNLEDALEECAAWLKANTRGLCLISEDEMQDLYREAAEEMGVNLDSEETDDEMKWSVYERAEMDLTRTESGFVPSWEWGVCLEDPTKDELIELANRLRR